MPCRAANCCLVSTVAIALACAPREHARNGPGASATAPENTQIVPVVPSHPNANAGEQHFTQTLGIDAPFQSIDLFVSNDRVRPRARLVLTERPVEKRIAPTVELAHEALCFERLDGATTTFHVRGETSLGPLDWRFEWPAPASSGRALQITIGLYREPSRPVLVRAAAP